MRESKIKPVLKFIGSQLCRMGRVCIVGIATRYGLNGPGIETLWGKVFTPTSRHSLGHIQPPAQWELDLFPGGKTAAPWYCLSSSAEVKKIATPLGPYGLLWEESYIYILCRAFSNWLSVCQIEGRDSRTWRWELELLDLKLSIITGSKRAEYTKQLGIFDSKFLPTSLHTIQEIA